MPYYHAEKTKSENPAFAHRTPADEIVDMGNDVMDQLLADFSSYRSQHSAEWTSFTSVGLALNPTKPGRYALMLFRKVPDGYRIADVAPNGPVDEFAAEINLPLQTLSVLRPGGPITVLLHALTYQELPQSLTP